MPGSGTGRPHHPVRDVTARLYRQASLTRTNKPKITNYSCPLTGLPNTYFCIASPCHDINFFTV